MGLPRIGHVANLDIGQVANPASISLFRSIYAS
jgi:hypothetical protein